MTERVTGRHRAPQRTSTPLSTLTESFSVVGDCVGSVRRGGVIIAMSSGLVASMGLPAHAVSNSSREAVGPVTASIPMVPGAVAGEALFTAPEGGLLALPPDLAIEEATIAAPAAATVDFDHSAFTVVKDNGITEQDVGTGSTGARTTGTSSTGKAARNRAQAPATRRERRAAAPAAAAVKDTGGTTTKAVSAAAGLGAKVVSVAFRYEGVPYLWGGTTPRGFDCSGFTKYVYAQLGVSLGRTVAAQRGDVKFVSRSQAKPGDLVFFGSSHVGIYLGGGWMIDSPHRGSHVQKRKVYSASAAYGRVVA